MIRVYLPDRELETVRVRGVGFQPVCECGWKGHRTRKMSEARAEQSWHRHRFHQGRQ